MLQNQPGVELFSCGMQESLGVVFQLQTYREDSS